MTTKTNQKINKSNVVIGNDFIKLLKADGDAQTKGLVARGALITKAMDDGIDFTSNTMSKEQIQEVKNLISLRYPENAQAILKMGAVKANGEIAADHDGSRFNSQGRPKDWAFWNNKTKRTFKDLADAVVTRQMREARIKAGGNGTRGIVERFSIECNKLFNAVLKADVDTLPDDFDALVVIEGFKTVAKGAKFHLVKKAKK